MYSKEELKRLIAIHVENPEAKEVSGLTTDVSHILTGVLEYKVVIFVNLSTYQWTIHWKTLVLSSLSE